MNINTARGIAARIWCDQEMGNVVMDTSLCEEIAELLHHKLPKIKNKFETGDIVISKLEGWTHDNIFIVVGQMTYLYGYAGLKVKSMQQPPSVTVIEEKHLEKIDANKQR